MDGYGSGQSSDRRLEIVSGKGFGFGNSNQIYATRPHSPNVAKIPPRRSQSSASKPWGSLIVMWQDCRWKLVSIGIDLF
ncbi:unnamed protein product [Dovyalis caffra]|uniref:Uncharacterized protein n=1 Tax=Dovyalis caffra TaxID=77055 RepID=A0AAV1SEV7_9ROSI|nr:unnamed protein product [Dovyalis caffra]